MHFFTWSFFKRETDLSEDLSFTESKNVFQIETPDNLRDFIPNRVEFTRGNLSLFKLLPKTEFTKISFKAIGTSFLHN